MGKDLKGKELGKNLYQRKDGTYEAKYIDNFGKRCSIYDKKLSEVRRKLNEALYEKEHNIYNISCKLTLNEWFDNWVEVFYKNSVKPITYVNLVNNYNRHVRNSKIGNILLTSINPIHIQEFLNNLMQEKKLQRSSTKTYLVMLNQIFKKARECNYINTNPVEHANLPKVKKSGRNALTQEEIKIFFRFAKKSAYLEVFQVLLFTGLRIGEALALVWDDIDFHERTLTVNKNKVRVSHTHSETFKDFGCELLGTGTTYISTPKTELSNRVIPLCDECYEVLFNMYEDRDRNIDLVFHTRNGGYMNSSSIDNGIWRICEQINEIHENGIRRFSAHSFRHTFTTMCFENGMNTKTVQYLLGHSNINTTLEIYTHLTEAQVKKEVQQMNFKLFMS